MTRPLTARGIARLLCAVAILLLASGCAEQPVGDAALETAAKTFTPVPGKAKLFVYRNEQIGSAVTMEVFVDGEPYGRTVARSYLVADLEPGAHVVMGRAGNRDSVKIEAAAGRIYYVWQEVKMGMTSTRNQMHVMDEKTGRAGVMECTLSRFANH